VTRLAPHLYEKQRNVSVQYINKELSKLDPRIDRTEFLELLCSVERHMRPNTYHGLLVIQMDAYLLSRLFVIFDKSKMNRGPQYCRDEYYVTPRHIIIHAGSMHTLLYEVFMKSFFQFDPKLSVVDKLKGGCVTLPKPFIFFE
jgi:hypothetical protein